MTNHANFAAGLPERLPNRRYDGNILTAQTCRAIIEINSTDLNRLWDSHLRSRCLLVPRQLNGTWWRHSHCLSTSRTAQRLRDRAAVSACVLGRPIGVANPEEAEGTAARLTVGACVLGGVADRSGASKRTRWWCCWTSRRRGRGGGAKVGRADAAVSWLPVPPKRVWQPPAAAV